MKPAPKCPSCGRPASTLLAECAYCAEKLPARPLPRAIAVAAALAAAAVAACVPCGTLAAMPSTFARLLSSPAYAVFGVAAATLAFAPFPAPLPGAAGTGRARLARELATRAAAFALTLFASVLACATFNH